MTDEQKQIAKTVTVKDRVAFALWLYLNADAYFRGFTTIGAVYNWLRETVAVWLMGLVGNGTIQEDALDAVLVRTIHAAAQQHFGVEVGDRDPVLTALGEGNNAGRHVADRHIGLTEIPFLYPQEHNATPSTIGAALRAELKRRGEDAGPYFAKGYQTTGGVPWSKMVEGDDPPYVLSPSYTPPALIQALWDKTFTDEEAEVVRAASRTLTLADRVSRIEQHLGLK